MIHSTLLTARCRVLPEQLNGLQLVKKLPHFTEPEGSSPHSQASATYPYPGPAQSSPYTHIPQIHPNIIHPSTPRSPQWSPSLRFPLQDPIHPLSSPIRATCPAHLILLDFITRTILDEQYRSFSSSLCTLLHSRYLVPPRSKYSPQHLVLKHPQLPFLPQCQRPSFTPIQNNRQNYSIYILIFKFWNY